MNVVTIALTFSKASIAGETNLGTITFQQLVYWVFLHLTGLVRIFRGNQLFGTAGAFLIHSLMLEVPR